MASTLRFDKWENTLGDTYGTVLQVVEYHTTTPVTISSTSSAKCYETSITTKMTNSKILVSLVAGRSSQNSDTDIALAMGYSSTSSSDPNAYTSLHGNTYTRQLVTNLGSFWAQDTSDPGGGTWNGQYNISAINFRKLHSPQVSSGTTLYYSLWGSSDGTFYLNRSISGSTDNGYDTSILLMEIAQ